MSRYFMGVDIGTTGGRACIFDDAGNLVGSAYEEYPCHFPQPGWVEQYSSEMLPALYRSCKKAIASCGLQAKQVEALSLSVQGPTVCLLDKDFNPLTPLIGWQDLRGIPYFGEACKRLEDLSAYYKLTGSPTSVSNPIAKYLWLQNETPKEWDECVYFSSAMEYFNVKFGADRFVTDPSMASRLMVMDIQGGCFDETIMNKLGMDKSKTSSIVPCGSVIGAITPEIAEKTGLEPGTKLVMGAMDQNASTIGMGMTEVGQAGFTLGTAGLLTVVTEHPYCHESEKLILKPNASIGNFTAEGLSMASASAYKWYRDTLCSAEKDAAAKLGVDTYDIMNQLARKSKPGANGVTFLNCLQGMAGMYYNFNAKGGFNGLTFSTTKYDMTRAVMEGVVYEEKTILDAINSSDLEVTELRLSGGGANSRTWCQMHADILGVPIVLLQCNELSALGAAMLAGIGAGAFVDVHDAVDKCVHVKKRYLPDQSTRTAYDEAYQRFVDYYTDLSAGKAWG